MPYDLPKNRTGEAELADLESNEVTSLDDADADTKQTDPGIDEIRDVLLAIDSTIAIFRDVLDGAGPVRIAMEVAPSIGRFIDAVNGLDEVPEEVRDLDPDEVETLAEDALAIVQRLI